MDIRNCKRCGKVFNYVGVASVCAECAQREQEDFQKVREYLFAHPNSTTLEVTKATGIDPKVISRLLKEGRLLADNIQISDSEELRCEKCGQAIGKGRFCEKCVSEMKNEFQKAMPSPAIKPVTNTQWQAGRVHTYEHIIKKKK
jgi:flagellar operon protein (TIGR03826 family)